MQVRRLTLFTLFVIAGIVAVVWSKDAEVYASSKRFMIGPYNWDESNLHRQRALWCDSMKSSWMYDAINNSATADSLMRWGLKCLAGDSSINLDHRGDMAKEYYAYWQTDPASMPPWFDGQWLWRKGRSLIDGGDTVWSVSETQGDSRGWVLEGPGCYNRTKNANPDLGLTNLARQAVFRVKVTGVPAGDTAAILIVKYYHGSSGPDSVVYQEMARRVVLGSTNGYDTLTLNWTDHDNNEFMNYPVYWYGKGNLYIDEIFSKSYAGVDIMNGAKDAIIKQKVAPLTYGSGDSVVKAWILNDEGSALENYPVVQRIDSMIRCTTGHAPAVLSLPFNHYAFYKVARGKFFLGASFPFLGSYWHQHNPAARLPTSYRSDYVGSDSSSLQAALDSATRELRYDRRLADTAGNGAEIINCLQVFQYVYGGVQKWRRPSVFEGPCLGYLNLAYGVDGLIYYPAYSWGTPLGDSSVGLMVYQGNQWNRTPLFDSMATRFAAFVDSLGDLFYSLKWINADSSEAVAGMPGSFIASVTSWTFPTHPYVEVAFFKDTTTNDDYFMLVNRRCLASENQDIRIVMNRQPGMYYVVDQFSRDTAFIASRTNNIEFKTTIKSGMGKLFRVIPLPSTLLTGNQIRAMLGLSVNKTYRIKEVLADGSLGDSTLTGSLPSGQVPFTTTFSAYETKAFKILPGPESVSGSSFPSNWEGGIPVNGNITIAAGRTWNIFPPACISIAAGQNIEIDVSGNVSAVGNGPDSVEFQSAATNKQPNDWYGIKILGAGTVALGYAQVSHAYKGIWIWNTPQICSVTLDNCLFDRHMMAGVAVDASAASAISISNSTFSNWGYYGIQVHRGKVDAVYNSFEGDGLNAIRIDGAYQGVVTGGHLIHNTFYQLTNPNATGIYIYGVTDDGLGPSEYLLSDNIMTDWTGANQVGIQLLNCSRHLRFLRTSIHANTGKPGYGILNNSTNVSIQGDTLAAESQSEIFGTIYGLYCWSGVDGDTDHATVRQSSFYSYGPSGQNPGYGVWVSPRGKVDLGLTSDSGANVFHGDCQGTHPYYTIYNLDTAYIVPATGNNWYCVHSCPIFLEEEGTLGIAPPCGYGRAWPTPTLDHNPFHGGGYAKLAVQRDESTVPRTAEFGALSNYPNPFNSSTVLAFSLAQSGQTEVAVYNILGQRVRTVFDGTLEVGPHQFVWDGRDEREWSVASGVYFYTVTAGGKRLSKSMIVLK